MANEETLPFVDDNTQSVESPDKELATLTSDGDPDVMLALLERKAELAPRFKAAIDKLLVSQTYPTDWEIFGEGDKARACLSSAGAERVGRLFDIKFFEVESVREEFIADPADTRKDYRYIFKGKAALGNRVTFAQGCYSSRDKFLGKAGGDYRPLAEINENNVRNAAYHIFIGNAIKSLLGIRGMPVDEVAAVFQRGEKQKDISKHSYGKSTQGGTSKDDSEKQRELLEICVQIADAGKFVARAENGDLSLIDLPENVPPQSALNMIAITLSTFNGKDGVVNGKTAENLKGKWLNSTIGNAKKLSALLENEALGQ